jgi:hypothetical protein
MSDDLDATIPDDPIEVLVSAKDTALRDETREPWRVPEGNLAHQAPQP